MLRRGFGLTQAPQRTAAAGPACARIGNAKHIPAGI